MSMCPRQIYYMVQSSRKKRLIKSYTKIQKMNLTSKKKECIFLNKFTYKIHVFFIKKYFFIKKIEVLAHLFLIDDFIIIIFYCCFS